MAVWSALVSAAILGATCATSTPGVFNMALMSYNSGSR